MAEEKVSSDTESSENTGSDDPETPQNEANDYEKQRKSRIAENKARMEAFGLNKIANTLMDMSRKSGKRKAQPKSKRGAKNSKQDDDYEPNNDEQVQNDDSSSEESEGKKKKSNSKSSGSKKVLSFSHFITKVVIFWGKIVHFCCLLVLELYAGI